MKKKIVIIGGGPAGLAAAISSAENGVPPTDILIIERENELGGILNQCIHAGFGLHYFGQELTGTEYAYRFIEKVRKMGINYITNSTVLGLSRDKQITVVSPEMGYQKIEAEAVILAMGCRERSRGALNIAGTRPAGIFSAGTAQRFVNIEGYLPGKEVVILGSGDIGLIMARRLTLEGAKVLCVLELMNYSGGLARNKVQCLDDFGIPLYLSHTVTKIYGKDRVEGVEVSEVDEKLHPIKGTEKRINCDTLLLSCGLIPENELSKEAGVRLDRATQGAIVDQNCETEDEGIFACGNVLHVHDLVDFVTKEAFNAGKSAALYINGQLNNTGKTVSVKAGNNVRYVVPQMIKVPKEIPEKITFCFRVTKSLKNVTVSVKAYGAELYSKKKQVCVPGEMEKIEIGKECLERILNSDEIRIDADGENKND